MSDPNIEADVRQWVELLRSKVEDERLKAAAQLGRAGVRTRGRGGARGSLSTPAEARMSQEQLRIALEALSDAQPNVRREVAFALGEWADAVAVTVLSALANRDDDARVRGAAVDALAKIGGPDAVQALQAIARQDTHEDVRASAIGGLGNLALASVPAWTEAPPARVRGTVRTRGRVPRRLAQARRHDNPEVAQILNLLEEVRELDSSHYVRSVADSTLAGLGE